MKAVYITEFGSVENLVLKDVREPPPPVDDEVVVRVHATGLNRADLLQVRGSYPAPPGYSQNIPGLEFAGEVAATGAAATKWQVGDRVFGITAGESQAEYMLSPESVLAPIPDRLNFTEAAAVPEVFITAHDAIVTQAHLSTGETLLVHAVGSGVGLAALQIAKTKGASVIGTSRTEGKLERCSEFGLDHGIVTTGSDFAKKVLDLTNDHGADVILDLVGAAYFAQNLESAARKARLMLIGLTSGATAEIAMQVVLYKRLTIIGTVLRARSVAEKGSAVQRFADDLLPSFASGSLRPNLDRAFPAADVVSAYKYLQSNESFGKVVLEF